MIEIRKITAEERAEALGIIISECEQHIFGDYTEEGQKAFREHVTAGYLVFSDAENFTLVARQDRAVIGVAKVRSGNHLSMLFVAGPCQRKGYGDSLLKAAIAECKLRNPHVTSITASGSRHALAFFLRHGFQAEGEEKHINGISFTPIRLKIANGPVTAHEFPMQDIASLIDDLSLCIVRTAQGERIGGKLAVLLKPVDPATFHQYRLPAHCAVELHFHDVDEYWWFVSGNPRITLRNPQGVKMQFDLGPGDMVACVRGIEHTLGADHELVYYQFSSKPEGGERQGHLTRSS